MSRPESPAFEPPPVPVGLADLGGISLAGVAAGIKPSGRPDVALLVADEALPCAGVFTQNTFAAAPVGLCRRHLGQTGGLVRAIVVNSGNANACTGERGEADAKQMASEVAALVGCPVEQVLVASTGVIGVALPMDRVSAGIRAAHLALSRSAAGASDFLAAIMTTDAFPKQAGEQAAALVTAGVAKGAGMIEPNMATMLAVVGTNARVTARELAGALPRIAQSSFNAVHVDSHASTNDSFFTFATGRAGASADWQEPLSRTAERLAWLIARDGEGATKVTTIVVTGAPTEAVAREVARLVAHSALVRTALFGCDPNWGRLVSAAGNSAHGVTRDKLRCSLAGVEVFRGGEPTRFDRAEVSRRMASDDVAVEIDLGVGEGRARVMTSDLGYRYVEVNAEYTT